MLIDFARSPELKKIECDICIVGSGPLGFTVAKQFLNTPFQVALLEGGGKKDEVETQKLYRTDSKGLEHKNFEGRLRIYGGTSTKWAGQVSPFDDIDFEERDWVQYSGWPLQWSDLEPHFPTVESLMQVEHRTYGAEDWPNPKAQPPAFASDKLRLHYSQFSPQPNFKLAYGNELEKSQNTSVYLHANATHLQLDPAGNSIEHIVFKSLNGHQAQVKAKYYFLCCGGIETPRLMLASNDIHKKGIANQQDMVGRFFQDHIHMHLAEVTPKNRKEFLNNFKTSYKGALRFCPKIVLSEKTQREHQVLNIAGDFYFRNDFNQPLQTAKDLIKFAKRGNPLNYPGGLLPAIREILTGAPSLLPIAYKYFLLNQAAVDESGPLFMGIQSEQEPNPQSRIEIGKEKDKLGVPKASVDWRLSSLDKKTIDTFVKVVDGEFKRLSLGDLKITDIKSDDNSLFPYKVFDSNHHMGTTRMSEDPKQGVVDSHCKVHGLSNLYISGTSVLPTCGFSNPTVNAMALAIRSCQQVKQRMG